MRRRIGNAAVRVDHEPPSRVNTHRGSFPLLNFRCYSDALPFLPRRQEFTNHDSDFEIYRSDTIGVVGDADLRPQRFYTMSRSLFTQSIIDYRPFFPPSILQFTTHAFDFEIYRSYAIGVVGDADLRPQRFYTMSRSLFTQSIIDYRPSFPPSILSVFTALAHPASPRIANTKIGCQP